MPKKGTIIFTIYRVYFRILLRGGGGGGGKCFMSKNLGGGGGGAVGMVILEIGGIKFACSDRLEVTTASIVRE